MTTGKTISKRQEVRERQRRRAQRERLVIVGSIVGISLLLLIVLAGPALLELMAPVGSISTVEPFPRPQANRNTMGDPSAPVKIIEFSDFQCPACGIFFNETEPALVDTYVATGLVHFTYRSMGDMIGAESFAAAEAAYCAADQGKFWEYHDMLFGNQTGENIGDFTGKRLRAFAQTLGLNTGDFNTCLDTGKYKTQVNQDIADAISREVQRTPTFFINGTKYEGALSFDNMKQIIDSLVGTQ